jgi:hypothetical protein
MPASALRAPAPCYDLIVVRQPDLGRPLVEAIKHPTARQAQLPDANGSPYMRLRAIPGMTYER